MWILSYHANIHWKEDLFSEKFKYEIFIQEPVYTIKLEAVIPNICKSMWQILENKFIFKT